MLWRELLLFGLFALFSGPLTKRLIKPDPEEGYAWWKKVVIFPLSLILWWYLLFPLIAAAEWAEAQQSDMPPYDTNITAKGVILMSLWLIVVCQIFYRLGHRSGKEEGLEEAEWLARRSGYSVTRAV